MPLNAEDQRKAPITEAEVRKNAARYAEFLETMRWLIEDHQWEGADTDLKLGDALNLVRLGDENVGSAFMTVGLPTRDRFTKDTRASLSDRIMTDLRKVVSVYGTKDIGAGGAARYIDCNPFIAAMQELEPLVLAEQLATVDDENPYGDEFVDDLIALIDAPDWVTKITQGLTTLHDNKAAQWLLAKLLQPTANA